MRCGQAHESEARRSLAAFGEGQVEATYGDNYARLATVKMQHDPKNLFRVNQNIAPAGGVDAAVR